MTASCIYECTIRHRRFAVRQREFSHRIALAYIDLDELPQLLAGRLVSSHPGLLRFRRRDYHGDRTVPLRDAVRDTVLQQTGWRPDGPIRVLAHPRMLGHCFNPVALYYCMSSDSESPRAVVAEVTNTPWRERHAYVLPLERTGDKVLRAQFDKQLHVSPFMGMRYQYTARLTQPGETLSVHIESRDRELAFDATLALRRRELTPSSANHLLVRYPLATIRVLALIYAHALGLKRSGVPVHPHPIRGRG